MSTTQAVIAVDNSAAGAIYKGLAIATTPAGAFLYAADFHNARVDVFDGSFHPVATAGGFADPDLPSGFAPFGIQNLQGLIYVTYAQQDADAEDEVAGPGLGFVSVFDPDSGEVAPFEEQIGSHGGLGGRQNDAFILHPKEWGIEAPPVGAVALHKQIRRWLRA